MPPARVRGRRMGPGDKELAAAVTTVAGEYDADVFVYSGAIEGTAFGQLLTVMPEGRSRNNALLILTTNGGNAGAAYQIARLFQKAYQEFIVFLPSVCKSAGTLLAIGAHRLIMIPTISELGPLDVQLQKQNEIFARKSGLLTRSSFEALGEAAFELYEKLMLNITLRSEGMVSFRLASELSADMASKLMAPIFAQINPDTVGSENRDLNIAWHYGVRLAEYSQNTLDQAIQYLINEYPSHDFIIDDDEARKLFFNVNFPSADLMTIVALLQDAVIQEQNPSVARCLTDEFIPMEKEKNVDHSADGVASGMAENRKTSRNRRPSPRQPADQQPLTDSAQQNGASGNAKEGDNEAAPANGKRPTA